MTKCIYWFCKGNIVTIVFLIFPIHCALWCSFRDIAYGLLWGYKRYHFTVILPAVLVGIDQPVIAGALQGVLIY